MGVTAILVTCSYNGKEFFRVGYYINVAYMSQELNEAPPATPAIESLGRIIMTEEPRVTNFPIEWDTPVPMAAGGFEAAPTHAGEGFGSANPYDETRREMLSKDNIEKVQAAFQQ